MKITQMTSPRTGKAVANQIIIKEVTNSISGNSIDAFYSYGKLIAKRGAFVAGETYRKVTLDATYWNYSKTTSKYRNEFLGETTKETQAKIDSGEYVLANLN